MYKFSCHYSLVTTSFSTINALCRFGVDNTCIQYKQKRIKNEYTMQHIF